MLAPAATSAFRALRAEPACAPSKASASHSLLSHEPIAANRAEISIVAKLQNVSQIA
jgi:hypothetical protein